MDEPLSGRNPRVKVLAALSRSARERRQRGLFVIDGPTLLGEAIDAGVAVEAVFAGSGAPESVLARARAAGAQVHAVAEGTLARAVDVVTPQSLAAVARIPRTEPAVLATADLVLVLVGVGDPGNVGTLVRAAAGAGAGAVACVDATADPWSPKVVRASAGAVFHVPVVTGTAADVLHALAAAGTTRLSTVVDGATPYDEVDCTGPVAVVLGSEAHGLPDPVAALGTTAVSIPMAGPTESLNVAMAGSILLFEVLRQRRHQG